MQSTNIPTTAYRLADHVRACRVDGQVILLDLLRNKYLGVGGSQLSALAQRIVDWPASSVALEPSSRVTGLEAWLGTLLEQRMLTQADAVARSSALIEEPLETLSTHRNVCRRSSTWRDLFHLASAAAVAAFWTKRRCLAEIADRVARLRQRASVQVVPSSSVDLHSAVSTYMRLRPFLFTAHDQCLLDSLSLVRFLAYEGLFPSWVIGVRTRPFAAHSWVQTGHLVLNDFHEHARTFTPILVV